LNTEVTVNQVIKSVGKNSLIYGFSTALQPLAGFILLPLYSKYFEPSDYGIYTLIVLISTIFSTIFYLGINSAFVRSYYDYDLEEDRIKVFNTSLLILIIGLVLQIVIGFLVSTHLSLYLFNNENYDGLIVISVITSAIAFINTGFLNYLRVKEKAWFYTVVSMSALIMNIGMTWYFLNYINPTISSPIYAALVTQLLLLVMLVFCNIKNINLLNINIKEVRILLKFGLPCLLASAALMIGEWGDKFLINEFLSRDDLGVFSMAFRISLIYNALFAAPFALVWSPLVIKMRNYKNIKIIVGEVAFIYCILSSVFILGTTIFLEQILYLLNFHQKFNDSISLVPFIMIASALGSLQNIYSIGIFYARKPILLLYIYLLTGITNFVFSWYALINFGLIGVISMFILFRLLTSIFVYFISSRYFSFQIFNTKYLKFIALCISFIFIYQEYISVVSSILLDILSFLLFILIILFVLIKDRSIKKLSLTNL
jgi:O-antigen/teichoic acid export membrane protein